jgi:ATP-dependent RNA helicase DDX3X
LSDFKSKKAPILVATDVAARGLDIPNVTNVVNYDAPNNIDDYVHRIGRTGRAGKEGLALTLLNEKNIPIVKELYTLLCETKQEIPSWFEQMYRQQVLSQKRGRGTRRGYRYTGW